MWEHASTAGQSSDALKNKEILPLFKESGTGILYLFTLGGAVGCQLQRAIFEVYFVSTPTCRRTPATQKLVKSVSHFNKVLRDEPLMIWGGLGKSGGKNLNCYLRGKNHQPVGQEKKTQHEFSVRGPPPRSLMVHPLRIPDIHGAKFQ